MVSINPKSTKNRKILGGAPYYGAAKTFPNGNVSSPGLT
jgi:hypothetical protein